MPHSVWTTTKEAAQRLGCAERTVVLYLNQGTLVGERKGKAWHVDTASVDRLLSQRRVNPPPAASSETPPPEPATPAPPRTTTVPPRHKRPPDHGPHRRSGSTDEPGEPHRDGHSFRDVSVLRTLSALAVTVARTVPQDATEPIGRAALDAALSSSQHGAAGYHAYLPEDKIRLYARAREQAAMAAAALWICAEASQGRHEGLRQVALSFEHAASALGGLMRKVGRLYA